jgi:hypothetical protein
MKEKFTITKKDQAFMNSIDKNLHSKKKVEKKPKVKEMANKMHYGGEVIGKSHYSGKHYKH